MIQRTSRRLLLQLPALLGSGAFSVAATAVQPRSLDDPMRLAVDDALIDSGFAVRLQRAFGRDTGVAIKLIGGAATSLLEALERGEHDAALTNAPEVEAALDKQGLVHDRRFIASSEFVLVGPAALAKPLAAGGDVALALTRLAQAGVPFVSRGDGSGTHIAEQACWRAAKVQPQAPWYQRALPNATLLAQARDRAACAIVERGVWSSQGGARGLAVLTQGDSRLAVDVHVMRAFRVHHPSAKLFVNWIAGKVGQRTVASVNTYRTTQR